MTRPSAETNEPEPPVLKRTDDFCRWSYHDCGASKPYFFFRCSLGGLLKSQRPSSAGRELSIIKATSASAMGAIRFMIPPDWFSFSVRRSPRGEVAARDAANAK